MNRYLIIIEETASGYSAYSPDLPGCAATGGTREAVEGEMRDAIEFHLDGLRLSGEPIPKPRSQAAYCEIAPPGTPGFHWP
jgi:predicted RNase H-like HicB family nuclease